MSVVEVLEQLGGVATRATLVRLTSRAAVDRALAAGDVVALARGRYALPVVDDARAAAHRLSGVVSYTSAALLHGWAVHTTPPRPHVTLPRKRQPPAEADATLHWANLGAGDVDDCLTSQDRTMVDCLRSLDWPEALAVADSALRSGYGSWRLREVAAAARGPGARQVRRVADEASALAANPFESALRAIALDVVGLRVTPQVEIWEPAFLGRVDLADRHLRIVLEADSFAWHGSRDALASDCRRYNQLAVHGWLVLRFSWEDVHHHPAEVRAVLEAAVAEQAHRLCAECASA